MKLWPVFIFLIPTLAWALAPINNDFKDPNLDTEFKNIYDNAQPKEFTQLASTPALSALRDGEAMIVSSNTFTYFVFRAGQNIFRVEVSCITAGR